MPVLLRLRSAASLLADFHRVEIGDHPYWLPRLVRAEVLEKKKAATYSAEYSGCKKFEVSVRMIPPS